MISKSILHFTTIFCLSRSWGISVGVVAMLPPVDPMVRQSPGGRLLSSLRNMKNGSGKSPCFCQRVLGVLSSRVKVRICSRRLTFICAKGKNRWSYTSLLSVYIFMAQTVSTLPLPLCWSFTFYLPSLCQF
jgi:hypothetical protein